MKSKKILTILLSLAIMLTFMPTMAFAGSSTTTTLKTWGDMYASATDNNDVPFATSRTFSDGVVTAAPIDYSNSKVEGEQIKAPNATAHFYDLEGSSFVYGAAGTALDGSEWTRTEFESAFAPESDAAFTMLGVKVVEQSYVDKYAIDGDEYKIKNANKKVSL